MRRSKPIEIELDNSTKKTFVVKELTVQELIDLTQNNKLFGGAAKTKEEEGESIMEELFNFKESVAEVMKVSCDFSIDDVKGLAPGDIEELYKGWREVNQTFLSLLEKTGVLQAFQKILEKGISDFLKTLAI